MSDAFPTVCAAEGVSDESAASSEIPFADADLLTAWLSQQYFGRLRMFASRRLRDYATAEDVVQEALKTILEALRAGRIRDRAAVASFAFETIKNLCMHRGRSRTREERALERVSVAPVGESADVLNSLIGDERRREVRLALQALDDDDRRLLIMTFVDARSSDDIGREMALTAGAVRVRRHRALKRLASLLGVTPDAGREQE